MSYAQFLIFLLYFQIFKAEIIYINSFAFPGSDSNVFRDLNEAFSYLENASETNITLIFLSNLTLSEQIYLKKDMNISA